MTRLHSALILTALLAPACVAATEDVVGGTGEAPLLDEDASVAGLPGASAERPCGERTVASVALADGNHLALCVLESGRELFVEHGPMYVAPAIDAAAANVACGLDLYLANTAADAPVPAALVAACPAELRPASLAARSIVDAAVLEPIAAPTTSVAYNCSAADSTFASLCYQCSPYDDCADWCVTARWGWHDRTMSGGSFLGEEGNVAMERNASCSGSTRVRAYEREDAGDSWGTPEIDFSLSSGRRSTTGIIHHSAAIFGQDYDFRLRADSSSGAYHLHSGYFLDE